MKKLILLLIIAFSQNIFSNTEIENQFIQANILYKKGDYIKALNEYEKIDKSGFKSSELYYNIANTYFKLKQIPNSILNYEKALILNPNDEDIINNLQILNSQIVDKIDPVPQFFLFEWFNQLIDYFNSTAWGILTIVFFWLAFIALFIFILFGSPAIRKITLPMALFFITIAVCTFSFASIKSGTEKNSSAAIVMSPSAYVKSSPDEKSTDLFILHEGTKVKILDELSDFINIKLSDGRVGWINKSYIEKI